ncbi:MAG: transcription antitermination factor NusB [Firmicutes bacterium]|nr:transcription antitermination factor NusB [Bacillota bacterium]
MNRRADRENLVKMVYEMHMNSDFSLLRYEKYCEQYLEGEPDAYFELTSRTIIANRQMIDEAIERNSTNWKISRMPAVDLAILRVAAAEILYESDVPDEVSINEAVELAKKYGIEKSPGFINGLLGSMVREHAGQ